MSSVERRKSGPTWLTTAQQVLSDKIQRVWPQKGMISFRVRRLLSIAIVVASLAAVYWLNWMTHAALLRSSFLTGWTLLVCLGLLIAIGLRRRIAVLPLGKMSTWTQVHIYTGAFAIGVFLLHAPAVLRGEIVASGWLEGSLSLLFWGVSLSGIYGLIASRRLPIKMTQVGEQTRYDQIAWRREQIAAAVNDEVDSLSHPAAIRVIGDFRNRYLRGYLSTGPSLFYLAIPTSSHRRRLLSGLQELNRYLEDEGKVTTGKLSALVRRRDDLDYQYALQFRLRIWVAVHAVVSILLVVLAIIHAIFATRFMQS